MLQGFKQHLHIISIEHTTYGELDWRKLFYLDKTTASLLHSIVYQLVTKVNLLHVEVQTLRYSLWIHKLGN